MPFLAQFMASARVGVGYASGRAQQNGCAMFFLNRSLSAWRYAVACLLAIGLPMGLGYLMYRVDPGACYDGPCLFPLLLVIVPPVAAPVFAGLFAINRSRARRFPDGVVPTVLVAGVLGQVGMSVFALASTSSRMREIFFYDILSVPQGFFVGTIVGGVFWVVLYGLGRKA